MIMIRSTGSTNKGPRTFSKLYTHGQKMYIKKISSSKNFSEYETIVDYTIFYKLNILLTNM